MDVKTAMLMAALIVAFTLGLYAGASIAEKQTVKRLEQKASVASWRTN